MSRDDWIIRVLQYLWDEGFLRLWIDADGTPRIGLTTEISEVHTAIRAKFRKKADPADWWKNEQTQK